MIRFFSFEICYLLGWDGRKAMVALECHFILSFYFFFFLLLSRNRYPE